MPGYMTRQRMLLLSWLQEHADESLTSGQIVEALAGKEPISASAVYRNLAQLERDGKLRRSTKAGSQEAYYRYAGAEACRGALHLSCLRCGRTRHMERAEAERLCESLLRADGFSLDRTDTVLYGLCAACRE